VSAARFCDPGFASLLEPPGPPVGTGLQQDVLVVVVEAGVQHREAGAVEQPHQRADREVRAVLVVDVPEGDLAQHPEHVGQLEEDGGGLPPGQVGPEQLHEPGHVGDVLQRVAADHEVGRQVGVLLAVQVGDEADPVGGRAAHPVEHHAGVDPDAAVVAQLADAQQELALAAAELEDVLVVQVETVDQAVGEVVGEPLEAG
jgi:hypothetical protein